MVSLSVLLLLKSRFSRHRASMFSLPEVLASTSNCYYAPLTLCSTEFTTDKCIFIALEVGQLVKDEFFTLYESIGAIEVSKDLHSYRVNR